MANANALIENIAEFVDPDDARYEIVTECNFCEAYRRGECSWSGLPMAPDDYCSKAVRAEA